MDEELLETIDEEELEEDDFVVPSFLDNSSEEEIHKKMLDYLPDDIDKSEGGYVYDLTKPTAIEVSRMKEFELVEALKLIWPRYAEGAFLDYHAETRGIQRKEAMNAAGILHITGTLGTVIPEGSIFTTESINDEPEKEYETLEEATITAEDGVDVKIQCTEAGLNGNSAKNTVNLEEDIIEGIAEVTNPEPIIGGAEEEDDESLRERIMEYDQSQGDSFVGNVSDYKRWALSVEGVDTAIVFSPEDNSGKVKIVITPANDELNIHELKDKVTNYIMSPDNPENRLAPVNAKVEVVTPDNLIININAAVELKAGAELTTVTDIFRKAVNNYLKATVNEGKIRYTQISNILGDTEGVYDYSGLVISKDGDAEGKTDNIAVDPNVIPEAAVTLSLAESSN